MKIFLLIDNASSGRDRGWRQLEWQWNFETGGGAVEEKSGGVVEEEVLE